MKEVRLNNGVMMPAIGFGVFQIPASETEKVASDALEVGYRMIDTASSYFNEEQVGNAIRHSGLKREELFITTKLWVQDYEYENALRAFDKSLKLLGLDYIDLYLLHKPYGNYYAAWRAAERLYKEGRIRAIGVTSFSSERLQDLFLHNEIKPAVNQLETHPFFQQKAANMFLQQEGIQHEAWAPFAEGKNDIWNNPVLKAIAEKHERTVEPTQCGGHPQDGSQGTHDREPKQFRLHAFPLRNGNNRKTRHRQKSYLRRYGFGNGERHRLAQDPRLIKNIKQS